MATFLIGLLVGGYTGIMLREEYYFPTKDKIALAYEHYSRNEISIAKSEQSSKSLPESSSNPT